MVSKSLVLSLAVAALSTFGGIVSATSVPIPGVSIVVSPSVAPNFYGSPSWSGYQTNAMTGLQTNTNVVGNRATNPTGYIGGLTSINPSGIEVTSFPSWDGVANPSGAFASELGNRLHFGVTITSAKPFDLAEVSFSIASNDAGNSLGYVDNLVGTNFGSGSRIGINYGADGILGTGDDIIYNASNPGSDTSKINVLYYVGAGNAEWPGVSDPDPSNPLLGRQGSINAMNAYILGNITAVTGTYTLTYPPGIAYSGSASVSIVGTTPVPLPASVWSGFSIMLVVGAYTLAKRSARRPTTAVA